MRDYDRLVAREHGVVAGRAAMKAEIYRRGPISCSIEATRELDDFKGGGKVFAQRLKHPAPNHVVSVVGWTVVGGVEAWITRNSWVRRLFFGRLLCASHGVALLVRMRCRARCCCLLWARRRLLAAAARDALENTHSKTKHKHNPHARPPYPPQGEFWADGGFYLSPTSASSPNGEYLNLGLEKDCAFGVVDRWAKAADLGFKAAARPGDDGGDDDERDDDGAEAEARVAAS